MKTAECIVVFTKAPLPNQVKTRLIGEYFLDVSKATILYEAFLSDVLRTVGLYGTKNHIDLIISYTPKEGLEKIKKILKGSDSNIHTSFSLQEGVSFDERMNDAFLKAFQKGYEIVVVIGGDLPTIRESHLSESFKVLRNSVKDTIVVGPGIDGGVYLIGLRKGSSFVFDGIFQKREGSDVSLALLEKRAQEKTIPIVRTSIHYDIDVLGDMELLRKELKRNSSLAPHTRSVLKSFGLL